MPGVAVQPCNLSTWNLGERGDRGKNHHGFKASLGNSVRLFQKAKLKDRNKAFVHCSARKVLLQSALIALLRLLTGKILFAHLQTLG